MGVVIDASYVSYDGVDQFNTIHFPTRFQFHLGVGGRADTKRRTQTVFPRSRL